MRRDEILAHFDGDEKRYQAFVEDGLARGVTSPLAETLASTILGRSEFVRKIEETCLYGKCPNRDVPDLRKLGYRWSVDDILAAVESTLGAGQGLGRKVAIYLCHRHSEANLREIGERFGIGESAVSQESRRLLGRMSEDENLRERN